MALCEECKATKKNAKFIKCAECDSNFHTSCAAKTIPSLTEPMIDIISKSNGVIVFKCKNCLNNPKSKPSDSEISLKLTELEASIKHLSKVLSEDIIVQLKDIKSEVTNCSLKAKKTEEFVTSKIKKLEQENNSLRRQINRNDIIVYGLSGTMTAEKMHKIVFNIGKVLDVEINNNDLNVCTYIHNKKSVLVKLNSVYKRDIVMKKYFAAKELKLCEIDEESDIESRVYLNDNLTGVAAKLNFICRQLRKNGKITKFKFYNKDVPEAQLYFPGGDTKIVNLEKIYSFLKEYSPDAENNNSSSVAE